MKPLPSESHLSEESNNKGTFDEKESNGPSGKANEDAGLEALAAAERLLEEVRPSAPAFADLESLYAVACITEAIGMSVSTVDADTEKKSSYSTLKPQLWTSWHAAGLECWQGCW